MTKVHGASKAKESILNAFNQLVLKTNGVSIRVSDIVRQADVGRSTFYEHFPNVESVMQQALTDPFRIFAQASLSGDIEELDRILEHFAENTKTACSMMSNGLIRQQMVETLAKQYDSLLVGHIRSSPDRNLCARHLAESGLGIVYQWLDGNLDCDVSAIARFVSRATLEMVGVFQGR